MSNPNDKHPGQGFVPVKGYQTPAGTLADKIERQQAEEDRRRRERDAASFAAATRIVPPPPPPAPSRARS